MICFSKSKLSQWLRSRTRRSAIGRRRLAQQVVERSRPLALQVEAFETKTLLAAFTWSGATSSDWDTSGNWNLTSGTDGDGVPDSDDDVTYSANGTNGPALLPGNRDVGSLTGSNGTQSINLSSFTLTIGANNATTTYGGAFSGTGGITKTGSGIQKLNGFSSYSGATTITGGSIETGDSPRNDTTNLGNGSATNSIIFNGGNLRLGIGGITSPAARNLVLQANATINDTGSNSSFAGVISGAFNFTKSGAGQMTLSGVNTFGGSGKTFTLDGGQIFVAADSGMGDAATKLVFTQTTIVNSTASFASTRDVQFSTSGGTFRTQNASTMTLSGQITGTFGASIQANPTGSGTVVFTNGTNSYTGTTNVSTGNLRVTANGALGGTTNGVTTANGTSVDFQNVTYSNTEPFDLAAGATLRTSSGTSSFNGTVNVSGSSTINVDGTQLTLNGVMSGTNGFTKTGTGILVLTATSTATGTDTISAGTLLVNGSTASGTAFNVSSGATIGGTGTINGAVTLASGATMAPGASPESLSVGNFTAVAGSSVVFEIGGTTAATQYDQIIATSSVSLGSSTLVLSQFNGFAPSAGQNYTIIDKTIAGAITGTFSGLPEGALISNFLGSGNAAYISYAAGDGNDVVITTNSAPVLDATQSPALTRIDTDNQTSSGDLVSDIVVNGSITDVDTVTDPESIAVTSVDNTNGVWQYSTDGGSNWLNFSATTGANIDLSSTSRLLLPTHKIRFVPNLAYVGNATFTFRAWDQTTGTAGSTADTSTNGGMTAYSSATDSASIFVGTIETSVALDGSGNLVVTDINGGTTNDALTVSTDGTNIIVTDPNVVLDTSVGSISSDFHTVTVPLTSITGSQLQFSTLAGSDSLNVSFATGNFTKNIVYTAGNPAVAPGDSLTLTGGSTFTTVTHTLTNENDGTIDVTGSSQISYTGLEPVTDNLSATNRVFTFNGGAETITVTDTGGADGKTTIDSTLGESVTFTNPTASLTINAGTGDDTVTVTSIDSAFTAALTINGDGGTDTINSNAALTLGSGTSTGAVSLTAESILVTAAINTTAVTTGTIALSGTTISLGANLSTDSADITIAGSTSVSLTASVTIDTESGNNGNGGAVSFSGTGQLQPDGTKGRDLTINTATTFAAATGGAVTLPTIGLNTTYLNDISVDSRASNNGVITVGGNITTDDNGVASGGTITLAGDVRIAASRTFSTADADTNGGAIDLSNATVSATAAGANLTLTTESTKAGGTGGAVTLSTFNSAGTQNVSNLTIDTNGTTTTAGDITFNSTVTLSGSLSADGRTISLPNAASDLSVSGTNTIGLTATKEISLASGSSLTAVNGNITLSANQQATATTGDFTGILLSGAAISTSGGTGAISLTGKGGTGASENDGVRLAASSSVISKTGTVTITGTTNSSTAGDDGVHIEDSIVDPTGAAIVTINGTGANSSTSEGVFIAKTTATTHVKSQGGAISITGTTSGDDGVEIQTAQVTNQSTGTITITGTGGSVATTSDGIVIGGGGSDLISVANGNMQLIGTGGLDDGVDLSGRLIRTQGSGNITITGTGGSGNASTDADGVVVIGTTNVIQSDTGATGSITIGGTATAGDGVEFASTLTLAIQAKASGKVTITGDGGGAGNVGIQDDAPITTNSGNIALTSEDDITFAATGDITSTSGNVTLIADNAAGNNGGVITQADGALINAGSGVISLTADGSITLGGLLTTSSSTSAAKITSTSGAIVDGGDTHVDVSAANGTAIFSASTGIGAANAIETTIAKLAASTTTSAVKITETDTLTGIVVTSGGDITLVAGGAITDSDVGTDATGDHVVLQTTSGGIGDATRAIDVTAASTIETSTSNADQYLSTSTTITIGNNDLSAGAANTVYLVSGVFFTTASGGDITSKADVASGATLAGTGAVSGAMNAQSGSFIQPGFDAPSVEPGTLTTDAATLNSGSTLSIQIGGNTVGNTASDYDQLATTGAVTISSATLNLSSSGGYVPQDGDSYTIINNTSGSTVTGTFSGYPNNLITPNFLGSGLFMQIKYNVGAGNNDVVLNIFSAETDVSLDGSGNLIISDVRNGGVSDDDLTITLDGTGTNYVISDPNNIITTAIPGATGDGTTSITVPVASVTGTIQFATLAGNDSITVDYASGLFTDDIVIDGGTQTTSDSLTIKNAAATFTTITHSETGTGAGSIAFASPANGSITYSALEAITDSLTVENRVFSFSNSAQTIDVTDAAAANGRTNITSTAGTPIDFTNPSVSFTLNGGTANDVINLTAVDSGFVASVHIDAGSGTDTLTSAATLTLGSASSVSTVEMYAENLTVNGAINTVAGSTETIVISGGTVAINAALTTDSGTIDIDATDNITFSASGDVTSATGNVTVLSTGGAVTQTDGSLIDAGSADIYISALNDIAIAGLLTTSSTATAINVTSTSGQILDNGDTVEEVQAPNGTATLDAPNGIGAAAGAGFTNSIETIVDKLIATTSNTNIDILENDSLTGIEINAGTGDVSLQSSASVTDTDALTDIVGGAIVIGIDGAGTIGTTTNSIYVSGTTLETGTANGDHYLSTPTSITVGDNNLDAGLSHTIHLTSGTFFTTVSGGDISANAEVRSGATLAGTGEVFGTTSVLSGGKVSPGMSPGILSSGDITFAAGSSYDVEIGGNTPGNAANNHDQLDVTGTVTINSATLTLTQFNAYAPLAGDTYVIINNDGADTVSGTFSGYPDNFITSDFFSSGLFMRIDYDAGTNNNEVVLSVYAAETSVTLVAGDLIITDINGGTSNDNLMIALDAGGTNYVISDPGNIIGTSIAGATGSGTYSVTVPVASVTGNIQFATLAGNDSVTINLVTGNIAPAIDIAAGAGATDSLTIQNATFTTITHTETGVGAGTIAFNPATQGTITYSGLEAITDSLTVSNRAFAFSNSAQAIDITDAAAANGRSNITSDDGTPIDFTNPSVSFSLTGGSGNDTINLTAVDSGFVASVSIDGSTGTDSITSTPSLTLGSGSSVATVSMTADSITINGAIDTTAGATETITLTGGTIALNAGLTTDVGNVTLSGTGAITFAAAGDITSTSGNIDVTTTGGAITQTDGSLLDAGSGTIALSATDDITLGGLLTTNATATAITVSTTNGEILDGGDAHVEVSAANGTATLTAKNAIGATLGAGGTAAIETTVAQLVASTTDSNINILETDALSTIDLNAGTGNITLKAGGAVTDTDALTDITANLAFIEVTAAGAEIGSAANAIELEITTLRSLSNDADQYFETSTSVTISNLDLSAGSANTVHLVDGTFFTTAAGGDILSNVEVQSGATLAGSGDVTGSVSALSGSTVEPGVNAPGSLTVGDTTLNAGSTFFVDLGGTTPGNAATDHDQLIVIGTVDVTGATLDVSLFGGHTLADGDFYTIIDNDGADAVVGTFSGLPNEYVTNNFLGSGLLMQILYDSGDGNDVVLAIYVAETSVELVGGDLVITDINGGTSNDDLTIKLNGAGTHYVISDPNNIITTSIAGATGNGTYSVTVPVASVTGSEVQFKTLAGTDSITVDLSNGNFADNVIINGGSPVVAPGDTLILVGDPYSTVTHTATGVGAGTVAFSGTSMTITYSDIEEIQDELTVEDRTFLFDAGAETVTLSDDANAGDSESAITSTLGTFIKFDAPTVSLAITTGNGNDSILLNGLDSNVKACVSIDGGGDTDSIQINSALTVGSATSLGTVVLVAEDIAINAALDTTAVTSGFVALLADSITLAANLSTDGAFVSITGTTSVTVTTDIVIDTESGNDNNAGAIDFTGTGFLTGTSADLELNTNAAGQTAGDITLPLIQLSGGDGINDLLVTADGATDGIIELGGNITVDDNGAGDLSSVTLIGTVCLPASRTIDTSDADTDGGLIDLSNAIVSASVVGANLDLLSGHTGAGGNGGDVSLGLFDNTCGQNINDLTVDALSTAGTAGNVSLTNAITLDGSLNVSGNQIVLTSNSSDITVSGAGSVTLVSEETVSLTNGSSITAADGDVILSGNSAGTATTDSIGIELVGASITTTGSGNIAMTGQGGDDAGTTDHYGINLDATSTLNSNGTGAITVLGTGGGTTSDNYGIALNGDITSSTGAITVSGMGGGGTGSDNIGTFIGVTGSITSTGIGAGAATINVLGIGGTGTTGNDGTAIFGDIVSDSGAIIVLGNAGTGTGADNQGIVIESTGSITSTGTGATAANIELIGIGGSGTDNNDGVHLANGATITAVDGNIELAGTGGAGTGDFKDGIQIIAGASVTTTGVGASAGTISLNGTGGGSGGASDENHGLAIDGTLTTADAAISLTGDAGVGANSFGIDLGATAVINSSNNPVNFTADSIDITAGAASNSGTAATTIVQLSPGTNITLGAADSAGTLGLTDAELDAITAATLNIGDSQTGEITIVAPITRTAATDVNLTRGNNNSITFSGATAAINTNGGDLTLTLNAAGAGAVVSGGAATEIIADDLVINGAKGGIGASGNPLTMNVNTIATLTTNADQYLSELNSVTVANGDLVAGTGTVHLVAGTFITTATGTIPGATTVENGATLAGIGSNGPVHNLSGGTINPGTPITGVGTLGTGNLDLDAGSTYVVNANLPTAGNYDSISVAGTVDITGSTLNVLPIAGFGAASMVGSTLIIIANDGADPVVGEFAGFAEGDIVVLDGVNFTISYVGDDGNDVVLSRPILDVYVDDDWALLPFGTDPDGPGPANAIGIDAFPTIQEGVNAVAKNGTVHVYAGPYPENVTAPKNMTIVGENGHTTGAESDVIAVDANGGAGFTITGSKVTLDNIAIDDSSNGIVQTGSGDLTLTDVVSTNATGTGFLSTSTGDITISGGTYDGITVSGADDITLNGGTVSAKNDVVLSGKNDVTVDTNLDAGSSTVTINANSDGLGGGNFENCGFSISTTNDTAAAINITVNIIGSGTGFAHIENLIAGTTPGAAGGRITVDANNGAVIDCNAAANNITAGNAILRGLSGVGSLADPIETTVSNLEGAGGSGGFFDVNAGSLTIGGLTVTTTGISTTTGNIDVRVDGAIIVTEKISSTGATGNILLQANEDVGVGTGRDITINSGVTLSSPGGSITLNAGDDITTQAGSVLSAPTGLLTIQGDFNNADAAGSAISISSQMLSTGTSVSGGNDNDTYFIAYPFGATNSGTVTIIDIGGTDAATIAGTTGPDTLFFTSANPPTTATTDLVTRNTTTGEPIVIPNTLEAFTLAGDTGNDTFTVQPSTFFPMTVNGNAPVYGDPTVPPGDKLILDTLGNNFSINGGSLQVGGTLGGSPFVLITPISIEEIPLGPVSPTGPQRYDFNSTFYNSATKTFVQTPTQPGWLGMTANTVYSNALGFGWNAPLQAFAGSTDTTVDAPLVNDGHYWQSSVPAAGPRFTANVANGWVSVTIDYGSPNRAMDNFQIRNLDTNTLLGTNLSTNIGQTDHQTYFVQVTDGTLNLGFDDNGGQRFIALNGIDIRPAALFTMGFSNLPASPLAADGMTVDTFHLAAGPLGLLVTVEASLGTIVGVDADPYIEGFQVLTDALGNADVMIKRPSGAGTSNVLLTTPTGEEWSIQSIEYSLNNLNLTGRNFDFNTSISGAQSPTQATYQPVGVGDNYTTARGYGWTTSPLPTGLSNGTTFNGTSLPNANNDGQTGKTASTFRVDLPNGTYVVHYNMGDSSDHTGIDIAANGTPVVTDLSLQRNQITEESFTVTVTNGHLDLTFSPGSNTDINPQWVLNALQIYPAALPHTITPINEGPIPADGTTISTIDATSDLAPGTLVTVSSTLGTIVSPDLDPHIAGVQVAVGAGGAVAFDLKSPTLAGTPTVEWRAVDGSANATKNLAAFLNFNLPAVRRFDFGGGNNDSNMTNVALGFTGVRTNHNPAVSGFGWVTPVGVQLPSNLPTGKLTTDLYIDGHTGTKSQVGVFKVQANPGVLYDLRLYIGSACAVFTNVTITVEGKPPVTISTTSANPFAIVEFLNVQDTILPLDGFISITIQGATNGWQISGLDIATAGNLPPAAPLVGTVYSQSSTAPTLTNSALAPLVEHAKSFYIRRESLTAADQSRLATVTIDIADLSTSISGPATLGLAGTNRIIIDDNGAGLGWDTTPESVEANQYDLLSVLIHELGHILVHDHEEGGVMSERLAPGTRFTEIDAFFAAFE